MGVDKDIIVAFEFGSSAISGVAGRREDDGSFTILGLETEKTSESVRVGAIYNIDSTIIAITDIVGRLSKRLNVQITKAYVCVSGRSLHTVSNVVKKNFGTQVKLTDDVMAQLMDSNRSAEYDDYEILDVIPQKYIVDHHPVNNPVGVQTDGIEVHYLNVIARKSLGKNIRQCLQKANLEIANPSFPVSPLALGNALLSDSEKRSGCALVDFGAETTTVSIYTDGLLRNLVVIPIGGNNITADLVVGMQMDPDEAETLKKKYGIAYVAADTDKPQKISISNDRKIDENELQRIIGARQQEIIANAWHHIRDEKDKLLIGIITTGGAAQIRDMTEAIRHHTDFDRVKAAKSLVTTIKVSQGVITPPEVSIDTLIALLMTGSDNCVAKSSESDDTIHLPEADGENEGGTIDPHDTMSDKIRNIGRWLQDLLNDDN